MTFREIYNREKKKVFHHTVPTIVPILNDIKRLNKHDKPEKKYGKGAKHTHNVLSNTVAA